jgi:hypothetical protein
MEYNLPKSFNIGGQKIKVKTFKSTDIEGAVGAYKSSKNEIDVQTHVNGEEFPASKVQQIFCHEYVHCLFDHARREDLCANEELVDLMGELILQSLGPYIFKE